MDSGYIIGGKHRIDGPLYAAEQRVRETKIVQNVFKNDYSDLVFPTIPNGPRCKYINSIPWCPNNLMELIQKCVSELSNSRSHVIVTLSEIIYNIQTKIKTDGFSIYLLPWKPFSLIGEIEIDDKIKTNDNLYRKIKTKEGIISYIIVKGFGEGEIMSVLKPDEYLQIMKELDEGGMKLKDPLNISPTKLENEWLKRLHINKIDRNYFRLAIAQYKISTNMWYTKCVNILKTFQNYNPLFLNDDAPIETNLIMRLQTACSIFNYDYNIEKYSHKVYIRVPKSLRNKIVEFVENNSGRCSLNSLVREIKDSYQFENDYYGKIIWLLRHISKTKEDLSIDQHQLIFARNKNDNDESCTLSGDSLDFIEENLNKHFWRSLNSLENYYQVDLTKYEKKTEPIRKVSTFSKHIIICFPYGCDMRHVDDLYVMCPTRFTTKTDVMKHIRSHHGISRYDEEIIEKVTQNKDLINFVKNESEEDWVEKHLTNIEHNNNIGQLLIDFIKEILKKRQWRSSLRRCLNNLEDIIETKISMLKSKINDDTNIKNEIYEQKQLADIAKKFLEHYDSLLLKPDRVNTLLDRLYKELIRQQNILKDYVDICRDQKRVEENANMFGKVLTEDHSKLLSEAKINVATGKNFVNMIQDNNCTNQDDNSIVVALAMINAIHQHDYLAADQILKTYKDKTDGLDCTLLNKFMNLNDNDDGDKFDNKLCKKPTTFDMSNKHDDDDDDDSFDNLHTKMKPFNELNINRKNYDDDDKLNIIHTKMDTNENDDTHQEMFSKKRSLNDNNKIVTYKQLKSYERHTDMPLTLNQFQKAIKNEPTINIDTRHMSVYDISHFIQSNMLPGNDIIHVGKGYDKGTVTYELINPTKIYINLADYKGLLFQFLYLLKFGDKNKITYKTNIQTVFLNIINAMFLLNDIGFDTFNQVISKALTRCFGKHDLYSPIKYETKKNIWTIFINSVNLLNSNTFGSLNGFFAVRLSRHGDLSGTAVKILGEEHYIMPHGFQLPTTDICLDNLFQNTHNDIYPIVRCDNKQLFQQQAKLINILKEKYMMEINNISIDFKSTGLIDFQPTSYKKVNKIFPSSFSSPHSNQPLNLNESLHPNEYKLSITDIPRNVDLKTGCNPMRSYNSIPSHNMTEKDLNLYEKEIDEWREKECCICFEPFSTRPLEGLNCMYRKLENEFRVHNHISKQIIWEKDKDLLQKYIEFASEKIDDSDNIRKGITANGMHMFHRDCIRRHIHLSALDMSKTFISCPMCQIEIYDEFQKNVILANINEIACRLATEMESQNITTYTTDALINIKHNAETDDENGLLSYFGSHYINTEIKKKEDELLHQQLEEKSNMIYFKKQLSDIKKDTDKLQEYEEKLKMYLDIVVYKDDFSVGKAKNFIDCNDNEKLQKGFNDVFLVGRQCVV